MKGKGAGADAGARAGNAPESRLAAGDPDAWAKLPTTVDPASGDLKPARAVRKRQQLYSLVKVIARGE